MLWGVDGSLHFPLSSMNRLNQTEPATYAILLFWAFGFLRTFILYFVSKPSNMIYMRFYYNCKVSKAKYLVRVSFKNLIQAYQSISSCIDVDENKIIKILKKKIIKKKNAYSLET